MKKLKLDISIKSKKAYSLGDVIETLAEYAWIMRKRLEHVQIRKEKKLNTGSIHFYQTAFGLIQLHYLPVKEIPKKGRRK